MQIELRKADLLAFEGDAILLPTVSDGSMRSGLAQRVLEQVGEDIERDIMEHAPIAVGAAMLSDAPNLPAKHLIHAPINEKVGARVGVENIRRATRAALLAAHHYQLESIAVPGIGFGEQGVPTDEAARAIVDEVLGFKRPFPATVVLIETDEEMVSAFRDQTKGR